MSVWPGALSLTRGSIFFTSNVYKKKFSDTTSDWKTWHYVGSLPLQDNDAYDETIFTVERLPVRVD